MPIAQVDEYLVSAGAGKGNQRGYSVYTMSQVLGISGRDKQGNIQQGYFEQPLFYLSLEERIGIFRLCGPVNAVVTSRMNAISSLKWKVVCEKEKEEDIIDGLRSMRAIYNEYSKIPEDRYIIASAQLRREIMNSMPDVLPDLSNFDSSIVRYSKKIKKSNIDQAEQVWSWLEQPNIEDTWSDFIKKMVFDLMIHGADAIYKEPVNGKVENVYVLPGGSVVPLKNKYAGGASAFVQIMQGNEPQIYFDDEVSYANYIPSSARSYGMIPLEALINKVSESMLFDKLMAEQADGTKLPEKVVIVTENGWAGDIDKEPIPLDVNEQARIEEKLNQPKKGAIMTFSGNGVTVVDLSRENTMSFQNERQKDIRSEVAMVFNATNMEMNLTGSENTSGRETSEVQMDIMQARGTRPIIDAILWQFNKDILPFKFGPGYKLVCEAEKSEKERLQMIQLKMQTGVFGVNEVRKEENLDPIDGDEYNKPPAPGGAAAPGGQPDGSEMSPFNVKGM